MNHQPHLSIYSTLVRTGALQPATHFFRAIELDAVLKNVSPRGRVLDAGCGNGAVTEVLLQGWPEVTELYGIDNDETQLAHAKTRGIYREVFACPAQKLPFESGFFDVIFSNSVLEHFSELDEALAEFSRVLRPGGQLIVTVPIKDMHDALAGPRLFMTLYLPKNREEYDTQFLKRMDQRQDLSESEWIEKFSRVGLRTSFSHPYLSTRQTRIWEFIANITSGITYHLKPGRMEETQRTFSFASKPSLFTRALNQIFAFFLRGRISGENRAPYSCRLFVAERRSAE